MQYSHARLHWCVNSSVKRRRRCRRKSRIGSGSPSKQRDFTFAEISGAWSQSRPSLAPRRAAQRRPNGSSAEGAMFLAYLVRGQQMIIVHNFVDSVAHRQYLACPNVVNVAISSPGSIFCEKGEHVRSFSRRENPTSTPSDLSSRRAGSRRHGRRGDVKPRQSSANTATASGRRATSPHFPKVTDCPPEPTRAGRRDHHFHALPESRQLLCQ